MKQYALRSLAFSTMYKYAAHDSLAGRKTKLRSEPLVLTDFEDEHYPVILVRTIPRKPVHRGQDRLSDLSRWCSSLGTH